MMMNSYDSVVMLISALLYFSVAVSFLMKHQYAWSIVWLSYSIANFGLMLVKK